MTAAVPGLRLRQLARPMAPGGASLPRFGQKSLGHQIFAAEPQGDRIFVSLLSLNFMLLAFFIVLGAAASVDKTRARAVANNVRIAFSGSDEIQKPRTNLLTARQALQAGVSDALADILPAQPRFYVDNSDRIDVDVPEKILAGDADRDSLYDNIAQLLQMAPTGFRYALLITGGSASSASGKAAYEFAGNLVDRGVAPQDILIGSSSENGDRLHFSFLVFEGEVDDDGEPWSAGMLAPVPPKAEVPAEPPAGDPRP